MARLSDHDTEAASTSRQHFLQLIDDVQAGKVGSRSTGKYVDERLDVPRIIDIMCASDKPAIGSLDGRRTLTHRELLNFVVEFDLSAYGVSSHNKVGILVPGGPELAVCIFAVSSMACAAPVNFQSTVEEAVSDLKNVGAIAAIVHRSRSDMIEGLERAGLAVAILDTDGDVAGLFSLSLSAVLSRHEPGKKSFTSSKDKVLVLHTSGTSGTKKVVSYTLQTIATGSVALVASANLNPNDVNINLMPLYHIGGIARNLFSPILSGGSAMMMADFDPVLFWDSVEDIGATWYYAAPTMHHMILLEGKSRRRKPETRIRMIVNAAGGLLPSLAADLKEFFPGSVILPSYGMTECMPISAPGLDYQLERPGTSGRAIGPEVSVRDDQSRELEPGQIGNICLRGPPLFNGYDTDPGGESVFDSEGWFDTGDMGFLDADGYLYLTGRSKEVINRGGEIISPFEIEEAVNQHESIEQSLAFSAPHDVLQEAVGVVLVMKLGHPRIGLDGLRKSLSSTLHPSKFPIAIVYMDQLPRNATNKVLRIGLAQRLKLPVMSDSLSKLERMFEAVCPPKSVPLSSSIRCRPVDLNLGGIVCELRDASAATEWFVTQFGKDGVLAFVSPASIDSTQVLAKLGASLHEYQLPSAVFAIDNLPKLPDGTIDRETAISLYKQTGASSPRSPEEIKLARLFSKVLNIQDGGVAIDDDFFEIGGTSLTAGKLVALIRKELCVKITPPQIFSHRTVAKLAPLIKVTDTPGGPSTDSAAEDTPIIFHSYPDYIERLHAAKNPLSPLCLIVQLLPLAIVYPTLRMAGYFTFILVLHYLNATAYLGSSTRLAPILVYAVLSIIATRIFTAVFRPLFAIGLKWMIVGRYREGRYPLFGHMYLRRWLSNMILDMAGKGIFTAEPSLHNLYWRLLGAKIGPGVILHEDIKFAEPDLVSIGAGSCLDACYVTPFCFDSQSMVFQKIKIGNYCSIGMKTIICAGAVVGHGVDIGPLSSSYAPQKASPENRNSCQATYPGPPMWLKLFVGWPLLFFVTFFGYIPYMAALTGLILFDFPNKDSIIGLVEWFSSNERIAYIVVLRFARVAMNPFFRMGIAIIIKKLIIGRFAPGPKSLTSWGRFRHWLMARLVNVQHVKSVAKILGTHYEGVSVLMRLLGAKVGKHVYWPGSGVQLVEYDLLEVGDDAVFGSRSAIIPCDGVECATVKIGDGAMLADRCVLLPGSAIERGAIMGSGGLGKKGLHCSMGSVWVGSKNGSAVMWDAGDAAEAETTDTTTPFARAFYLGKAKYFCWPQSLHIFFNAAVIVSVTLYWLMPLIATMKILSDWIYIDDVPSDEIILAVTFALYCFLFFVTAVVSVLLFVAIKWSVIGQRVEGRHTWDESDYCQRWQIFLILQQLVEKGGGGFGILHTLGGSEWLCMYFRSLGAKIGRRVCLYPNDADPMMTEPDLVTIGDGACLDNCSVIAHINSKGNFSLNPVTVGAGATLRCFTRLLSGASMEPKSVLLEHTLVPSGDVVEAGATLQGWPAQVVKIERRPKETRSSTSRRKKSEKDSLLNPSSEDGNPSFYSGGIFKL